MKIALFHHLPHGGAKIALYEAVKRLKEKHLLHLYSFFSQEGEYDIRQLVEKSFLFPYEADRSRKHGIFRLQEEINTFLKLKKIHQEIAQMIDREDYDIVYAHHSRLTQAPFILRFLKTPTLYYCQEPLRIAYEYALKLKEDVSPIKRFYEELNRFIRKRIDRDNTRSAHLVVTSSRYVQDYIMQTYGIQAEVCPLGVDTKRFRSLHGARRNQVLFIGTKSWIDGYDLVKKSLELIKIQNRPSLRIISLKNGVFSKAANDISEAYARAKVTLCTAVLEPFGLVALESMACETPVVAINQGGYKETVIDGVTGFLVEPNPIELSEKLRVLIENHQLARSMGEAGRRHVKKHWTWEKHIEKLEQIFQKLNKHET